MTDKEAKRWFEENMPEWTSEAELYGAVGCYGTGDLVCSEPEGYAYRAAIKALVKADKYRWHDLRKNPEDLPTGRKAIVIVALEFSAGKYGHYITVLECNNGVFDIHGDNVVAWRWIEPFEEET